MSKSNMDQTNFLLAYGKNRIEVEVPNTNLKGVYIAKEGERQSDLDESAVLKDVIGNPIGSRRLRELIRPGDQVVINTSDLTRPCPSSRLLPPVMAELQTAGVSDEDIQIVLALGLHRPMTGDEIDKALSPEIHRRFKVLNHDPNNTVYVGTTSRGTPVEIFKPVVEADVRICLGNLSFHWFAGYSGGAKAIMPGCASRSTVTANHAMLVQPESTAGVIQGNPVRADLEEGVGLLGVDFILNAIVDADHRIIGAVAGDMIMAHRVGCTMIDERGKVKVSCKADFVIASAGGYPSDINVYQAHKGLENASQFVRDGGILILAAECREGIGNSTFESWMLESESPQDILNRIQSQFVIGGHKAAAIACILSHAQVYLVSGLPEELVRSLYMQPFASPQAALTHAIQELGPQSQVYVLPHAPSTLPDFG